MSDDARILRRCKGALAAGLLISDGCARAIAAQYAEGMGISQQFASTGAISDPAELCGELFRGCDPITTFSQLAPAACLVQYIYTKGARPAQGGWGLLWI